MNDQPIELKMTRDMMHAAVEQYLNRLMVGYYDVEKLELHARGGGNGAAATVNLVPRSEEKGVDIRFKPAEASGE